MKSTLTGQSSIESFRLDILTIYNQIALVVTAPLVFVYGYMGMHTLAVAIAAYFTFNIGFYFWIRKVNTAGLNASKIFILATILLLVYGHYVGDEIYDNKPWAIIIPIFAITLVGPDEGVLWVALSVFLLTIAYLVTPNQYEVFAIVIQMACMLTTAYFFFVFMRQNEKNMHLINNMSRIDPLTNTFNRLHFNETFDSEIRRAQRNNSQYAVLMLDIDHFKEYNDSYGHLMGDVVIERIARSIKETSRRAGDLLYRYGGEEFCLLLSNIDKNSLASLSNQLCEDVRSLDIKQNSSPSGKVTISIGYVHSDSHDYLKTKELLDLADKALYRAKESGRDRVVEAGSW